MKHRLMRVIAPLLCLATITSATMAYGQVTTSLSGTVTDTSGAVLPGADVVAKADETGTTFAENARLKALHYADAALALNDPSLLTIAEDSGLVVDALDGEPGVRSARFLRPDASYAERFDVIFSRLASQPGRPRTARFICALAAVRGTDVVFETTGTIEGEVSLEPRGANGFGRAFSSASE